MFGPNFRRNVASILVLAGVVGLAAPGFAAGGPRGTAQGGGWEAGAPAMAEVVAGGGVGAWAGKGAPWTGVGLGLRLWGWLLGVWAKEGAKVDPNGQPKGASSQVVFEKAGATIDPNGQPHASSAAGCQGQGDTGATADPNGGCGPR